MKWLIGVFLMLSLSGCVSDADSEDNWGYEKMSAHHRTWRGGGDFSSVNNATLFLYDEEYRFVNKYNLTADPVTIVEDAAYMWMSETGQMKGPMLRPMDADLENTVLVDVGFQELPNMGLGLELSLQDEPYADFHSFKTDALPTTMDVFVHGVVSNLEFEIRSPLGVVYKATEIGNGGFLTSTPETIWLEGKFYPENLSGTDYTVLVKADHLDGFISLTYQELAMKDRGHRFATEEIEDFAFVYGSAHVPVKVNLSPDAEWLILRAPTNQTARVIVTDGNNIGEVTIHGTTAIPAEALSYGIAPVTGEVTIGTDVVPSDFEFTFLEVVETKFSSGQRSTSNRQETWTENFTLPGVPFADTHGYDGQNGIGCIDYGAVKVYDENQTYAGLAPAWGAAGFIWNAKDVQVEFSSSNEACVHRTITVSSFLF